MKPLLHRIYEQLTFITRRDPKSILPLGGIHNTGEHLDSILDQSLSSGENAQENIK